MSEKIFACLLSALSGAFPPAIRSQKRCDCCATAWEKSEVSREVLRLWFDLLVDMAGGLPQAYRNSYAMVSGSPVPQGATGLPAFRVLDQDPLRPESVLLGSVLAFAALAAFVFVMNHATG